MIIIKDAYAVNISEISAYPEEKEYLLTPNSMLCLFKTMKINNKQFFLAQNIETSNENIINI